MQKNICKAFQLNRLCKFGKYLEKNNLKIKIFIKRHKVSIKIEVSKHKDGC